MLFRVVLLAYQDRVWKWAGQCACRCGVEEEKEEESEAPMHPPLFSALLFGLNRLLIGLEEEKEDSHSGSSYQQSKEKEEGV